MNNANTDLMSYFESLGYKTEQLNDSKTIPQFATLEDECFSLNNGVGLKYLNSFGIIELKGNDSLDFLHRITTNSLKEIKKEEIRKTIFTNEKGRILGIASVFNFESYLLLITGKNSKQKLLSWINKYIIGDDVKVSDASHRFNILELLGPQADSFITLLCGDAANELNENTFKVVDADGILFFLSKLKDLNGNNKYWILADDDNSKKLIDYMISNKGPFNFNLIGDVTFDIHRIEKGIPADPNELNDSFNPHEAKLIDLVDFKKGCYIGQEVIARLDTFDKVQKYLMGVVFPESIETNERFTLLDSEQQEVGIITSLGYSLRMKKHIGLAYINRQFTDCGTKLLAKNESRKLEVTVSELPFTK
jgi:folate-binding protein YgfZ